jgi:hypothetical protein
VKRLVHLFETLEILENRLDDASRFSLGRGHCLSG